VNATTSHFEREIREQADVLRGCLSDDALPRIGATLRADDPTIILTFARGSSDNAVTFFTYLAGMHLGRPVASVPPSLATLYQAPLRPDHALVIGVSQSGESQDVVNAVQTLAGTGARTLAIANQPDSSLERASDLSITLGAGEERAVAASKTFTSQMMMLARVVAEWADDDALRRALATVPDALDALLANTSAIDAAAMKLTHAEQLDVLGRGLAFGPAHEIALKLKETSYLHAHAYSSAEFHHGPIASLGAGDPVLLLGLDDASIEPTRETAVRLRDTGAQLTIMSSDAALLDHASTRIPMPPAPAVVQAFLHVVAGQWLALRLATERGLDPDAPRHLRKVTQTR